MNTYRRELSDNQKKTLAGLEKKIRLTDFDQGRLAAFKMFGDPDEQKRAERLLNRAQKEKKR